MKLPTLVLHPDFERNTLMTVMSFLAMEFHNNGKFRPVEKSNTISEAERRATTLTNKLQNRNVHDEVLRFCTSELLADNYFHAVFETTKSVADRIRKITGLKSTEANLLIKPLD